MVKIYLFVSLFALICIGVSSRENVATHRGNMSPVGGTDK
jgi:hypothetical protein